jgi:hypothetical protein
MSTETNINTDPGTNTKAKVKSEKRTGDDNLRISFESKLDETLRHFIGFQVFTG